MSMAGGESSSMGDGQNLSMGDGDHRKVTILLCTVATFLTNHKFLLTNHQFWNSSKRTGDSGTTYKEITPTVTNHSFFSFPIPRKG
jgi:hypothetical protein